jgi:hypothetical protein
MTGPTGSTGATGPSQVSAIEFIIDGGGSVPTTGLKGYVEVPFACTINVSTLLGNAASGSAVVDIFKCSYANFDVTTHPQAADKITASAAHDRGRGEVARQHAHGVDDHSRRRRHPGVEPD